MYCTRCGKHIPDDAAFCQHCGTKVDRPADDPAFMPRRPDATKPFEPVATAQQSPRSGGNGIGIAGFVCALLGLFLSWVPVVGWLLWILGAVLSLIGLTKTPKGLAIAGTVISFIDVILLLVLVVGGCTTLGVGGCAAGGVNAFSQLVPQNSAPSSSSSYPSASIMDAPSSSDTVTLAVYTASGEKLTGTVRRDSDGYVLPDSSTREYGVDELKAMGLTPAEICIAWNEPFAREGHHFSNPDLQDYFEGTDWYRDRGAKVDLRGIAAANNEHLRELADSVGDGAKWKDLAGN